jgi:hypothetical protein
MTIPEFFNQLKDGEEYLSILCTKQTFSKLNTDGLVINSVRKKNESFKLRKTKKALQDYEYEKNNI